MSAYFYDRGYKGPSVIRSSDPLVDLLEMTSEEDLALLMIALVRAERDRVGEA